jgi:putative peptide zinc metalloprotease protein
MKRLALLVLGSMVAATSLWVAAPASAQSSGNDNTAVASNTKDDSFVFKFAFKVSKAAGDSVDPSNAAAAVSSCSACETVAVAIQVVLVSGDPSSFTPSNVAIAYNQDCSECVTLADAFQFVFGTGSEPAHLTKEGKDELKAIKQQFKDLQKNGGSLPPDELQARINDLAQQVYQVYSTQLVPNGNASSDAATPSTTAPTTEPSSSVPSTTTPPTTSDTSPPTTTAPTEVTSSPSTTAAG